MPTLVRLSITPVKALRLSHPVEAELTEAGIAADRRFYFVDDAGQLFDASDHGPLLRIVAHHDPVTDVLRLTFPDGSIVEGESDVVGERLTTDFWGRPVVGHVIPGPLGDAVSRFVGRSVRLARVERDGNGQDARPLTIVSSESVADLGRRGGRSDLDARRFRINLEVSGCAPYEEDSWDGRVVRIGRASIRVRDQIPRCVVTTYAPDTGEKDFATLTEIARYRERIGGRGGLPFGMYADVVEPGLVRVGDPVEVSPRPAWTAPAGGR